MSSDDDRFENVTSEYKPRRGEMGNMGVRVFLLGLVALLPILVLPYFIYTQCRIEVPIKHMAVLIHKTGKNLNNDQEIAPVEMRDGEDVMEYRGVQQKVLGEGRYFFNPYEWDWVIVPQIEIPEGKLGVRTRLYGDNLAPGNLIAWKENEKGIVPEVLRPGRYAINARLVGEGFTRSGDSYAETIELFDPVTIPAGFKGVVTLLSAPMPKDPNNLLVEKGRRGVQRETLDPGTYYINPYVERINLVDCRSQRYSLGADEEGMMGFPSKDGFWVTLEGFIEFRIKPEEAARVFVVYNDNTNGERIDEEIVSKIILPNARSFCRLRGSNHSGREFIQGETRVQFQEDFQKHLADECESQGVEVIQALVTKIRPPKKIAEPVQQREIANRTAKQYEQQILQQASEQELAIERELVNRKKAIVAADQEVIKVVTDAKRKKEVALIEARQRLKVAEFELKAAEDLASAIVARGGAVADVIRFNNQAEAAGWKRSVEAFGGKGMEFARWVLLKKLAPAFRSMTINTADSPMMDVFENYEKPSAKSRGKE
ncbi:MAG TPA: SPFH domain-containing protein [Thermoguttaceae bacterium]|nr:SPFH domain-containing protein [Thermoguttaceae bacterium]